MREKNLNISARYSRARLLAWLMVLASCGWMAWPVHAQSAATRYDRPTEACVRFTPGMAQAMAGSYITYVAVPRYGLDEDKIDTATEAIARRLMAAAHSLDTPEQQASVEQMFSGMLNAIADSAGQPKPGMPREMGITLGKGLKPLLPAVREVLRGVGDDLRPMLPLKQQLNLGKDLLSAGVALDAFEKNMERWERGEIQPFENPFSSAAPEVVKDDQGRSPVLNEAMRLAQQVVDHPTWESEWERYVEQAKDYYQFDEAQSAAADSQLREALRQAESISRNDRWRRIIYRNRVWDQMTQRVLQVYGQHPIPHMIARSHLSVMGPITKLGDTMKLKIDRIATSAQRQEAEQRMMQLLADEGYEPDDF
ncbi:MAG: hypothetical protein GXY44_05240 [Phycisphaerales bacterium]|nr:hypothetical protein [Phycisphaerales bacterium]